MLKSVDGSRRCHCRNHERVALRGGQTDRARASPLLIIHLTSRSHTGRGSSITRACALWPASPAAEPLQRGGGGLNCDSSRMSLVPLQDGSSMRSVVAPERCALDHEEPKRSATVPASRRVGPSGSNAPVRSRVDEAVVHVDQVDVEVARRPRVRGPADADPWLRQRRRTGTAGNRERRRIGSCC